MKGAVIMGYLRIHCGGCGQTWEVYRKVREYDGARECPHCGKRIDHETWTRHVLPAFNGMLDANLAVMQDHVDYHQGAFKLDYVETGNVDRETATERSNMLAELLDDRLRDMAVAIAYKNAKS